MKKRLTLLLAFLLLSLTALSCNGGEEPSVPEGAVEVFLAYPGLSYIEEGPYDTSKYGDGTYARYGYTLYVTSENGKLILLPAHTDGSSKAPGVSKDTLMSCKNVQGFGGGVYFDGEKIDAMLQQVIDELPDVQRTVFQLRYYEEMKYSEISDILGTSEGALKASYHIAVKKILSFFNKQD